MMCATIHRYLIDWFLHNNIEGIMGELAALATSLMWTFTSIFFTIGGREVGSVVVNRSRLLLAVIFLSVTHYFMLGTFFPLGVESYRYFWLAVSGIIGLVIGDAFLFQAFVMIGPRISMLLMALVPVISTFLAWVFLGETLGLWQLIAIAITVSGVAWVVLESPKAGVWQSSRHRGLGLLAGLGGAFGQSFGLIAAKYGLAGDFPVLSGVLIRMLSAVIVIWTFTALRGKLRSTLVVFHNRKALLAIVGGSVVGPFIGVWLSLVAVHLAPVGIASTLMALAPVLILPIAHFFLHDKVGFRAVFGTMVALAGVAMIFMV